MNSESIPTLGSAGEMSSPKINYPFDVSGVFTEDDLRIIQMLHTKRVRNH